MHRILTLPALLLAGCLPFTGFVHDEVLDGPYRLVAVDVMEDMIVCRTDPGGSGDCFGDGLPYPRVIAAGADKDHLVILRHVAANDPHEPGAYEYYYAIRVPKEAEYGGRPKVIGPLTKAQFTKASAELGLPDFSRTFEPLP